MDWSSRAQKTLQHPQFTLHSTPTGWGECQWTDTLKVCWSGRERCEGWGIIGEWGDGERVMLESLGQIIKNKTWSVSQNLTLREIEAYLRDTNSRSALPSENYQSLEEFWPFLQKALLSWSTVKVLKGYQFPLEKVFKTLPLAEKIRELKSFFSSEKLAGFYRQGGEIEVLDVEDTTVYIALNPATIPEAALLDWLQMTLAETFREASLNLIPEGFPSKTP